MGEIYGLYKAYKFVSRSNKLSEVTKQLQSDNKEGFASVTDAKAAQKEDKEKTTREPKIVIILTSLVDV